MLRKALIEFSALFLFSSFLTIGINFDLVKAVNHSYSGTYVGGIIWENTTWTLENSPYIITETVQIPENVTLTIEPGVTVIRPTSGDMFLLHGRIEAHGTISAKIIFDGGGNSNFFYAYGSRYNPAQIILSYCIIRNGRSLMPSNGYNYLNLTRCEIVNVLEPCSPRAPALIAYNIFINWCSFIVGELPESNDKILIINNLFLGRSSFSDEYYIVKCVGHNVVVKYNTFLNIDQVLQVYPHARSVQINATENYWGTIDTDAIDEMIYDKKDDIRCAGFIEYLPILTEPHSDTPTLPLMVKFTYSPTKVYAYGTVTFDASASFGLYSSIINYTWDFGDGNITTTLSPKIKHGYAMPGNYNVTLTVADEFGFRNSTTTSIKVLEDNVSPATMDDYDGEWRNKDFTITLTAIDHESGVAETYYRINNGSVKAVSINGQPLIIVEGANNTLEYWSVDNAGNEELPHKTLTCVKLDKTEPSSSISLEGIMGENDWFVSNVTATLTANDMLSGIDYILYSFDNVKWEKYVGSFNISNEGQVTIYFKAVDKAGNMETVKMETVKIDKTPPIANAGQNRTVTVGETINFDASASTDNIGIASYEWNFGDGTTKMGKNVTHQYSNPGTYTVTLTVKDAAGNTATHSITLTATSSPSPTPTPTPTLTYGAIPVWLIGATIAIALLIVIFAVSVYKRKTRKSN